GSTSCSPTAACASSTTPSTPPSGRPWARGPAARWPTTSEEAAHGACPEDAGQNRLAAPGGPGRGGPRLVVARPPRPRHPPRPRAPLRGRGGPAWAVASSAAGARLASGGEGGTVRLWDVAAARERAVLRGHDGAVHAVAFSSGGVLASGGDDRVVRLWDVKAR